MRDIQLKLYDTFYKEPLATISETIGGPHPCASITLNYKSSAVKEAVDALMTWMYRTID